TVESLRIEDGALDTVSISVLVMLMVALVKAYWPALAGQRAEVAVTLVSLAAVTILLVSTDADWYARDTWVALIVGVVSVNVMARGIYMRAVRGS
ncbi:MAG TPA: hypothetical protein DCX80_06620, partial [Chloroflexi bacterium]|nr:hypothetical protein [Chloroflexota bacterium]